jgi:hypothetical protein
MTFKQIIKQVVTGAVTVGTAFGSAGILGEIINSGGADFVPMLMVLTFMSGTSFFGGKYFLKQRDDVKRLEIETLEKEILRLAVLNDGRLNVTEAVLEMDISVEKAKNALDHLSNQGVLQAGISEEGGISYHLVDYLGQDNHLKQHN